VDLDSSVRAEFCGHLQSPLNPEDFWSVSPAWNSDIHWISPRNQERFRLFEQRFQRLGLAALVRPWLDLESRVVMDSGFTVMRSVCEEIDLHVDWSQASNQAFICLTPLTDHTPASEEPLVLLSFTFGTDKICHWEAIAETAAAQGQLVIRPNASFQYNRLDQTQLLP